MYQQNSRRRYSDRLAHAAGGHKYIDKKLVKGKWVYYYNTPNKNTNSKYNTNARLKKQAEREAAKDKREKQAAASKNTNARLKKQMEREAAQDKKRKDSKNAANVSLRMKKQLEREKAQVKKEKKAAVNKTVDGVVNYLTGSSAKKKLNKATKDYNTANVKANTTDKSAKAANEAKAKKKAMNVALKDYEKTFPGQIEKGAKLVSNLLSGITTKVKSAVKDVADDISEKKQLKKALNDHKTNRDAKSAIEIAKYNYKQQARKKKKSKK